MTIGETPKAESIAAIAGQQRRPRPRALHTRFGPAVTAHRGLNAMKFENDDELAFFYGEE